VEAQSYDTKRGEDKKGEEKEKNLRGKRVFYYQTKEEAVGRGEEKGEEKPLFMS
jgi:hypothetical protein